MVARRPGPCAHLLGNAITPPPVRPMDRPGEPLRRIVGATLAVALDANGRPPWVLVLAGSLAVALDTNGRPPWVLAVA